MGRQKSPWRLVVLSYPCPVCNAAPGEPCLTYTGHVTAEHADRGRLADRCPKCGIRVGAEEDPGALCPRCALIRSLETERHTKWIRRDP